MSVTRMSRYPPLSSSRAAAAFSRARVRSPLRWLGSSARATRRSANDSDSRCDLPVGLAWLGRRRGGFVGAFMQLVPITSAQVDECRRADFQGTSVPLRLDHGKSFRLNVLKVGSP